MEIQIKKAIRAGNSSAVLLPRAWLNQEVRVELIKKTPEKILQEVLEILVKQISLNEIIGIYLVGSYARGEESNESDIDALVITNDIDKEMIQEGAYNILIASYQLINQKLSGDLLPIGQMIKEAKPLLNSNYLKTLNVEVTKKNVKWYLDTTKEKIKMINEYLEKIKKQGKNKISDRIAYTLVLRIRTLEIIKKLSENKIYSKKEFVELIEKISGSKNAYEGYCNAKNDLKDKSVSSIKEAEKLKDYLEKSLVGVKKRVK